MPNFNPYDFKRAVINFAQIFLIGYATLFIVFFAWSAASYGVEKILNALSLELLMAPIFWFLPMTVAVVISTLRCIRFEEIDFEWANQPRWRKRTLLILVVLYLYALLSPESEASQTTVAAMRQATVVIDRPILYEKLDTALADGKVMQSEYDSFRKLSLAVQMEEFKLENAID